jgi:hypothetical protein
MSSTIGGDDPEHHDLSAEEKDRLERRLRDEARLLQRQGDQRERRRRLDRAVEISRRKAKRADHH